MARYYNTETCRFAILKKIGREELSVKIECLALKPDSFKEEWPGQFEVFHWFEYICGIPHPLFMISSVKANGKPNLCYHSWSSFSGDGDGFFAVMAGLCMHTHTYGNILRTGEFCVNFLSPEYHEQCLKTIEHNQPEDDEFAVGGFTAEPAKVIQAPRIRESFLSLECRLTLHQDLTHKGLSALVVGKVEAVAIAEAYAGGLNERYGKTGFALNIHNPKQPQSAEGNLSAVGVVDIVKRY